MDFARNTYNNLPNDYFYSYLVIYNLNCVNIPANSIIEVTAAFSSGYLENRYLLISGDSVMNLAFYYEHFLSSYDGDTVGYEITVNGPNGMFDQISFPTGIILPKLINVSGYLFDDTNLDCIQQPSELNYDSGGWLYMHSIIGNYAILNTENYDSLYFTIKVPKGIYAEFGFNPTTTNNIAEITNSSCGASELSTSFMVTNDTIIYKGCRTNTYPSDTIFYPSFTLNPFSQYINIAVDTITSELKFYIMNYQAGDTVIINYDYGDGLHDSITIFSATQSFSDYSFFKVIQSHIYNNHGIYAIDATINYHGQNLNFTSNSIPVTFGTAYLNTKFYYDQNQNCIKDSGEIFFNPGFIEYRDSVFVNGTWKYNGASNTSGFGYGYPSIIKYKLKRTVFVDSLLLRQLGGAYLSPCQQNDYTFIVNQGDNFNAEFAVGGYDELIIPSQLYIYDTFDCQDSTIFVLNNLQYQCPDEFEDTLKVFISYGDGIQETKMVKSIASNPVSANDGRVKELFSTRHKYPGVGNYIFTSTIFTDSISTDLGPTLVTIKDCGPLEAHAIIDIDSNCQTSFADESLSGLLFHMDLPSLDFYSNSNSLGIAYFSNFQSAIPYDLIGSQNFTNGFTYNCPTNGIISGITSLSALTQNFYFTPNLGIDLFSAINLGYVRPGFAFKPKVSAGNYNYTPASGSVLKVIAGPQVSFVNSIPSPQSTSGDTLIYNITSSLTCGNYANVNPNQLFNIQFNFLPDTNLVVGDSVSVEAWVYSDSLDVNPLNNYTIKKYPVINSYDPNALLVSPLGSGAQGLIPENTTLNYTILFQNLGNAPAYYVRILDTIDINTLDLSTLSITNASHNYNFNIINNNILSFQFLNINLPDSATNPDGSNGFINFSIKLKSNLQDGQEIKNRAQIYFDYNEAIATNQTLNTVQILVTEMSNEVSDKSIKIYPNPSNERIRLFNIDKNAIVYISDAKGLLVKLVTLNSNSEIDISELSAGFYFIKTTSTNSTFNGKFVKK